MPPGAGTGRARVLLVTPPLLQPNAPYAALPAIAGFLKGRGVEVVQEDLSLALLLELFSADGMDMLLRGARRKRRDSAAAQFFLDNEEEYRGWVEPAVAFLQGRAQELAWRIAGGALPEGPHFRELEDGGASAGEGTADRAKLCASLFLDDVADLFKELVDPDFGFSRYAERLAVSAPTFDPLLARLRSRRTTDIDRRIDRLAEEAVRRHCPTHVGVTVPFPGTLYGAFRVAQAVRKVAPGARIVMGGGYVNSELRELTDERVFEFIDELCFDEGFGPWLGVLGLGPRVRTISALGVARNTPPGGDAATPLSEGGSRNGSGSAAAPLSERDCRNGSGDAATPLTMDCAGCPAEDGQPYRMVVPDYAGLALGDYFPMAESANPMHRLWSDGRWLKVQLSNGCYWHRCAFCDVALDYIGRYRMPDPAQVVDGLEEMMRATGLRGFHFTDEALSPALARGVSEELLRRGVRISWWGNVRLDRGFDAELAALMSRAGCIAVTAGLECADDRLLKFMRKGITVASARRACRAFAKSGVLVHVYLMYGFPTETEEETLGALETVRGLFAEGVVQSAFWHRFALTVHSPIARDPSAFGIELIEEKRRSGRQFARNEIAYREPVAPDLDRLGRGLSLATYNYMRGQGLDWPVREWFR